VLMLPVHVHEMIAEVSQEREGDRRVVHKAAPLAFAETSAGGSAPRRAPTRLRAAARHRFPLVRSNTPSTTHFSARGAQPLRTPGRPTLSRGHRPGSTSRPGFTGEDVQPGFKLDFEFLDNCVVSDGQSTEHKGCVSRGSNLCQKSGRFKNMNDRWPVGRGRKGECPRESFRVLQIGMSPRTPW